MVVEFALFRMVVYIKYSKHGGLDDLKQKITEEIEAVMIIK